MTGRYLTPDELEHVVADDHVITYLSRPLLTGSRNLLMLDAELEPGAAHARHRHPRQEEILYVISGQLGAWLGDEHRILGPGSVMFIAPDVPHMAQNLSDQPVRVVAVTSPCVGDTGHEAIPVEG